MKLRLVILLFALIGLSHAELLGQSNVDSLTEKSVMNSIWKLKEVQELNEHVIAESGGKRKLTVLLYKQPKETEKGYYWVKVAEDNGINFISHYNFFVYALDGKVMYFDTVNDREIELLEWRKQ